MKKAVICTILLVLAWCCPAQTKVAVYVTSSDDTEKGVLKIIGSELTAAIVATKVYSAVERTSDFLLKIAEEQEFQRTGAVDDSQISAMGKQFGVDMVCVVDVIKFKDIYYVNARLIDVEKATVFATSRESSSLDNMNSIISMSENLANSLFTKETKKDVVYSKDYSSCLTQPSHCQIRRIIVTSNYTEVYITFDIQNTEWISIGKNTYILDRETKKRYELIKTNNIEVYPKLTYRKQSEIEHDFILYFEPIPDSLRKIDLIEISPTGTGWKWENIRLTPYGEPGIHVFKVTPVKKATNSESFKPTLKMSTCLSCPSYFTIKKIIASSENTTIYCYFKNQNIADYISVSKKMYILDENTRKKYMLRNAKDITVYPTTKAVSPYGKYEFELQFDPIPSSSKVISIVHPDERSALQKIADIGKTVFFNCHSITLYPYSKPGEYILNFF